MNKIISKEKTSTIHKAAESLKSIITANSFQKKTLEFLRDESSNE
jgi:hypothetical protein